MKDQALWAVNGWRDVQRSWWTLRHESNFVRRTGGPQRLLVDVSVIARDDAGTGIQRVVRAFWHHLWEMGSDRLEVVPVAATRRHGYAIVNVDESGWFAARPVATNRPAAAGAGDIFLGLDLSAHALPRQRAQLRAWRAAGVSIDIVVYDLLPMTHPQYFRANTSRIFANWLAFVRDYADRVLCISDHVSHEMRAWLAQHPPAPGVTAPSVDRIHLGADIAATRPSVGYSDDCQRSMARIGDRPFLLMVGTVEPRKAYDVALDMFEHLWTEAKAGRGDQPPLLVIGGRRGWRTEALQARIEALIAAGRPLLWFDGASDEVVEQLYQRANGLILTSHAEGYGLPVAEAAHWRLPALVRDLAPLREIGGGGRILFNDDSPQSLAPLLWKMLRDPPPFSAEPPLAWGEAAVDLARRLGLPSNTACGSI